MYEAFENLDQAIQTFSQLLLKEGDKVVNSTGRVDYKEEIVELHPVMFTIPMLKCISTWQNAHTSKFWAVGEVISEIMVINPPVMDSYRPDLHSWAYESLLPDRKIRYLYGARIFEFSQLFNTYERLKKNLYSKKCVIQIFAPYDTGVSGDVPCFPGKTKILSPEGDITIEKLHSLISSGKKYPIFSMNEQTKQVEINWVKHVLKKKKCQLYRVNFDNGDYLDVTSEHKIYVKKQDIYMQYEKVAVKDLNFDDRIVPFTYFITKTSLNFQKNLDCNWGGVNSRKVQKDYYQFYHHAKIAQDSDVHHINNNPYDNTINNLQVLHHCHHSSITMKNNNHMFNSNEAYKHGQRLKKNKQFSKIISLAKMKMNRKKLTKKLFMQTGRKMYNKFGQFNTSIWSSQKINFGIEYGNGTFKQIRKLFGNFQNFNILVRNNHKIVSVKKLNTQQIVYDIEVENNHNYFVKFTNLSNYNYDAERLELKNKIGTYKQVGCLVSNCNVSWNFLIRPNATNNQNYMDVTVFARSIDFFGGLVYDPIVVSSFSQMLCSWLSDGGQEVIPGNLHMVYNSLHYYPKKDRGKMVLLQDEICSGQYTNKFYEYYIPRMSPEKFYKQMQMVVEAERASFYGNFDKAASLILTIETPILKDFASVYFNKNAKTSGNLGLQSAWTTDLFKEWK